jgi:hypothetical protein
MSGQSGLQQNYRGVFDCPMGFGRAPAIIVVDFIKAYTEPGSPLYAPGSDRHVLDHAPAQRAHRLVGHGDAPALSEGFLAPHLQDRASRPAIVFDATVAPAPYRASGLVP